MPKKRIHKTKAGITCKFRIGNAKGGASAHGMTTAALLELLENKDKSRSHNNARHVLRRRGVMLGDKTVLDMVADGE